MTFMLRWWIYIGTGSMYGALLYIHQWQRTSRGLVTVYTSCQGPPTVYTSYFSKAQFTALFEAGFTLVNANLWKFASKGKKKVCVSISLANMPSLQQLSVLGAGSLTVLYLEQGCVSSHGAFPDHGEGAYCPFQPSHISHSTGFIGQEG